jgi:choline dehydrogenase-like flavoprotein
MEHFDIIVVGGGPSGLTAALYAARAGKSVLVLEMAHLGGQITYAPLVENYPGIPGLSGADFADSLAAQVEGLGAVIEYEQVLEVVAPLNGSIPQRCHNARAQVRYMAHLDNPEKFQYSVSDIRPHGGVDLAEMLRPCSSERYTLIGEMMERVKLNGVTEFADLIDFALVEHPDDWLPLLCDSCAIIMSTYITSCRYRAEARRQQKTAAPPTQQANNQGQ